MDEKIEISLRCGKRQKRRWKAAADAQEYGWSDFVRQALDAWTEKTEKEASNGGGV